MSIQAINSVTPIMHKLSNVQNKNENLKFADMQNDSRALTSVSGTKFLSQMPNVSFKSRYSGDDLSAYDDYSGPTPPLIEIMKYQISQKVQNDINNEDYMSAIQGKIKLAGICHSQGSESDAYMLECSIRDLYSCLPLSKREEAKTYIGEYNSDMAKYIDEDIKN